MQERTFIINVITVVFVAATLYFLFKNNNIPAAVKQDLQPESVITSSSTASGVAQSGTPTVVTPGPLLSKVQSWFLSSTPGTLTRSGIIADTNVQRGDNAVPQLTESVALDASAQVKANDILARQYFEHTAPDGVTVSTLVTDQGYDYIRVGENLALGDFKNDQAVVDAWMNSPGHRANILDPKFMNIGVGVATGMYKGQEVVVAVQHFGRPASSCPIVDDSLETQITTGQAQLERLSASLNDLQAQIDKERGSGEDTSGIAASYNKGIDTYNADYAAVEKVRTEYNTEVQAFNACLVSNP